MDKLYYSIGETAEMLGVNASTLRFWESEFDCLKPYKNKKGNRSYTSADIQLLKRILYLTRDCGYTLEGAREQLKNNDSVTKRMELVEALTEVRNFLVKLKNEI